ncbi:cell division protein FtsA [Caldisalinibacter kiritimatiensis]|uniref:Cell division protein FtsA n=1 Tax=Caldisalinibacter kiritimatiensis TaxID=1304284 RepID=R1AX66_9FIRM|nr:cell division protein FtsA [Caldisalinibacter kiritimatiensis]EOD01267.1 Cell division protein FtsA [Caldisalinibacter kiritimatiensis]
MTDFFTSIDLGTSKVCAIIAGKDKNGQVQIIGMGKSDCNGIKKGVVVDIESTTKGVINAVEQAENMADVTVTEAYINIPGGYSRIVSNKGMIAVSGDDNEISLEDIERVITSATIISVPQDQRIIDVIPNQYIVDGYDEIKDPTGMVGTRLEVEADIVTASVTTTQNLIKSINKAGIDVVGIFMEPLATANSVLTDDEKELGVLLIDIGAGTSDISIFKKNRLIYSNILLVGGNHITNDLSIGLRIPFKQSEEIKRRYGAVEYTEDNNDNVIEINPIGLNKEIKVSKYQLSEIIEARVGEVFELIDKELHKNKLKKQLLAGAVITGGGVSYLKGIEKLAGLRLGLPVRIGKPNELVANEPIYSTAVGIINYVYKRKFKYYIEYSNTEAIKSNYRSKTKNNNKLTSLVKKVWKEYF